MPPLETRDRPHTAVLWPKIGVDEYGEPKVSDNPVEIKVLWNNVKKEVRSPEGQTITISAEVSVDRDIEIGSLMALLPEEKLVFGTSLRNEDVDLMQVWGFNSVDDIKGRPWNVSRVVSLMRYTDVIPEVNSGQ